MSKQQTSARSLGDRMMSFRKAQKLTQADLATRYKVSAPAIFKFEKSFVTPSLKLWQTIAADMGIPDKEAVLLWAKEKLPPRMQKLIHTESDFDEDAFAKELDATAGQSKGSEAARELIVSNPQISPSLKKFLKNPEMWDLLQPTIRELKFLIDLDKTFARVSLVQFREIVLVARDIQGRKA